MDFDKETAVTRAQAAVADAISQYKASKRLGSVTVTAMRAKPQPYWRDSVSENLFYKPDIVKSNSYTVCWHGRGLALCLHLGRQSLLVIR